MDIIQQLRSGTTLYDPLSSAQTWILTCAGIFSSTLSLIGSIWLLTIILGREKERFTYHRIIMMTNVCNILGSLTFCLSPFLASSGIRDTALGNEKLCSASGFLTQASFSVPLYTASLSVYYLLYICFEVDKLQLAQKYEFLLHFFPLLLAYAIAFTGLFRSVYEEVAIGLGCWVSENLYTKWFWVLLGLPYITAVFTIMICILLVIRSASMVEVPSSQPGRIVPMDITRPDPRKVRQDAVQCLLYGYSAAFCLTWTMAARILDAGLKGHRIEEGDFFWLILIAQLTFPLRGVFDFFIYLRPAVLARCEKDRSLTKFRAFHAVLFGSFQDSTRQLWRTKSILSALSETSDIQEGRDEVMERRSSLRAPGMMSRKMSEIRRSSLVSRSSVESRRPKKRTFGRSLSDDSIQLDNHGDDWNDHILG